jgi:hypothetical protein
VDQWALKLKRATVVIPLAVKIVSFFMMLQTRKVNTTAVYKQPQMAHMDTLEATVPTQVANENLTSSLSNLLKSIS